MATIAEVEQLVKRLYTPGEPHVLIQEQLQHIQKSPEGWQLADALLGSHDVNVRFFGALTFTVKLNGPFDESTATAVLERLKYWLVTLANDSPIVIRKLTSTLVTYFIRTPVPWEHPLQELQPLTDRKTLLLFSGNLAEEMYKHDHTSRLKIMDEQLVQAVKIMAESPQDSFQCFHSWTHYCQTKSAVRLQPLIPALIRHLNEDAYDVFIDLLESYWLLFLPEHLNMLGEVVNKAGHLPLTVAYGVAVIQDVVEGKVILPLLGEVLQSGDFEEVETTIEFWNTYVEYVADTSTGKEEWLPQAKATMLEASILLLRHLKIQEITDEFKSFRTDTADLLSSMYITLGRSMMQRFIDVTLQGVEEGVFCLNAIADNAAEHNDDELLLPLLHPLLTGEYDNHTRRTIIDMIGEYGDLLKRHPEHIPDAVRYLFASLDTPLADIAAKSIYELCSTCRTRLTGDLQAFITQYNTLTDSYIKEKVIGGIAAIIQALPDEQKVQPLLTLLDSIEGQGITTLQCLASMAKASQEPDDSEESTFWQGPGKVVQDRIISCFVLDGTGEAVDTACQVLKKGYTETSGPFAFPASVTVNFLQQCTIDTPSVESVLAATALLVTQHSRSDKQLDARPILDHVVSFIQALQHPSADPSIAQNCLDVITRLLRSYLDVFLYHPGFDLVCNFAIAAIEAHDIMPKRSALDFWPKLIRRKALGQYGPVLTTALIRQIAGVGQRSDLDIVKEPLRELLTTCPEAKAWIEAALWSDSFPSAQVGDAEKKRFLSQLTVSRGARMKEIITDFYAACRGVVTSYS